MSASVLIASLFAQLKAEGRSALDELDRIARIYGLYVTMPLTFRVENLALIAQGMETLRSAPPATLAGSKVTTVADLSDGYNGLPPTDALLVETEARDRVIVRPSGTEPKLKCYLEVILDTPGGGEVPWDEARARLETIKQEFALAIGI